MKWIFKLEDELRQQIERELEISQVVHVFEDMHGKTCNIKRYDGEECTVKLDGNTLTCEGPEALHEVWNDPYIKFYSNPHTGSEITFFRGGYYKLPTPEKVVGEFFNNFDIRYSLDRMLNKFLAISEIKINEFVVDKVCDSNQDYFINLDIETKSQLYSCLPCVNLIGIIPIHKTKSGHFTPDFVHFMKIPETYFSVTIKSLSSFDFLHLNFKDISEANRVLIYKIIKKVLIESALDFNSRCNK